MIKALTPMKAPTQVAITVLKAIGFEELDAATVVGEALGSVGLELAPESVERIVFDGGVWIGARGGGEVCRSTPLAFGSVARPEPVGITILGAVVPDTRPVAVGLGIGSCRFE